jgi:hypothetical protein
MIDGSLALTRSFVLATSLAGLWSAPRLRGRLSLRDVMKVARQFIAWNTSAKRIRPVGYGPMGAAISFTAADQLDPRPQRSHRTLRDGPACERLQAINCLATFISSLRDNPFRVSIFPLSLPT